MSSTNSPAFASERFFAAGDTYIVYDLLKGDDAITIDDVLAEVPLGPLYADNGIVLNRPGAFVAAPVAGSKPSTKPYLRCPSSVGVVPSEEGPIMRRLRLAASAAAGVPFNHAKVQLYETRGNKIALHGDKVLDMCEDDSFVSFRLGATRAFTLRSKADPRVEEHIAASNNSAIVVGPRTNREWTHGVCPDGRKATQCTEDELAWGERSLSIIFRRAVTFWRSDGLLFGEGAKFKSEEALERALQALPPGQGRLQALSKLGKPQEKLHTQILTAWGQDNKSWTATRRELYGPIIEGSVLWERTPQMEPASVSSAASSTTEENLKKEAVADATVSLPPAVPSLRDGKGNSADHIWLWIGLGGAMCLAATFVSLRSS